MQHISKARIFVPLCLLLAWTLVGCRSAGKDWRARDLFSLDRPLPWEKDETVEPQVPDRIVCAWTETVMTRPGQPPQRGFGGRLHFYGNAENDPVPVAGQLVVYAFDETGRDPADNRPTKRYVFPPEQFARHRSDSSLGASYSFWLPWDQGPAETRDISLICRFEPVGGPLVVSEQTRQRLQGTLLADETGKKSPPPPAGVAASQPVIQQTSLHRAPGAVDRASHAADSAPTGEVAASPPQTATLPAEHSGLRRRMTTTSISLPSSFRRD